MRFHQQGGSLCGARFGRGKMVLTFSWHLVTCQGTLGKFSGRAWVSSAPPRVWLSRAVILHMQSWANVCSVYRLSWKEKCYLNTRYLYYCEVLEILIAFSLCPKWPSLCKCVKWMRIKAEEGFAPLTLRACSRATAHFQSVSSLPVWWRASQT